MRVTIRQFEPKDLETLRELNREVFLADKDNIDDLLLEWPDTEIGQKYYEKVVNNDGAIGFLAEIDSKPVGYVALAVRTFHFRTSKFVEIENIGVSPEFRSHGIGKQLLETSLAWAKEQNADKLLVEAFAKNTRGLDFYREFGFYDTAITLEKDI